MCQLSFRSLIALFSTPHLALYSPQSANTLALYMNHSCHICSIGFANFPLFPINTSDNVFTAFWTVALRTSVS